MSVPDLSVEHELVGRGARRVGGMDEVGRGALAGPVSVGLVVLTADDACAAPAADSPWHEVRDSKALSPARREALAPRIRAAAAACAVGHAAPAEIDALGITAALRLAGLRALAQAGVDGPVVDGLVLDGSHNWLAAEPVLGAPEDPCAVPPLVRTLVKADTQCVSVAAASVLAKVERDELMARAATEYPPYGWASNKGYGSAVHRAAIAEHGVTDWHRRSWRLGTPVG